MATGKTNKINRDALRDAKIKRLLEIQKHGFEVTCLNDTQFRIKNRLDIYVMNCKYHDIVAKERGVYKDDPIPFILGYNFKKKKVTDEPLGILKVRGRFPRNINKELAKKKSLTFVTELFGGRKVEYLPD